MKRALLLIFLFYLVTLYVQAQPKSDATPTRKNYPTPVKSDYVIPQFHFKSGEILPELRLHYNTIGTPVRDNAGVVRNAVLILPGTGGAGNNFLSEMPTICFINLMPRRSTIHLLG